MGTLPMNNKAFQSVFRTIGGAEKDVVPREQCSLIGNKRHHYDEDFKRQAVRQLIESGKPVTAIAQSIGVERTILQKWRKKRGHLPLLECCLRCMCSIPDSCESSCPVSRMSRLLC